MSNRNAIQPGYRSLIRTLLIIAGLLGAYAALQPLRARSLDQTAAVQAHNPPDAGWSRAV